MSVDGVKKVGQGVKLGAEDVGKVLHRHRSGHRGCGPAPEKQQLTGIRFKVEASRRSREVVEEPHARTGSYFAARLARNRSPDGRRGVGDAWHRSLLGRHLDENEVGSRAGQRRSQRGRNLVPPGDARDRPIARRVGQPVETDRARTGSAGCRSSHRPRCRRRSGRSSSGGAGADLGEDAQVHEESCHRRRRRRRGRAGGPARGRARSPGRAPSSRSCRNSGGGRRARTTRGRCSRWRGSGARRRAA